jgi:hypothetical protein
VRSPAASAASDRRRPTGSTPVVVGPHGRIAGVAAPAIFLCGARFSMDIEHVNSIGSLLADLSARTEQLRGYL